MFIKYQGIGPAELDVRLTLYSSTRQSNQLLQTAYQSKGHMVQMQQVVNGPTFRPIKVFFRE